MWPEYKMRPDKRWPDVNKFTLRMFDYFDGWIDIENDLTADEAVKKWLEETRDGTIHIEYTQNGYYYDIFPSNTKMVFSSDWVDI